MDKSLTFNQMIRQTYFKISRQFLISLFLFYLLPMLLTAFTNITEKMQGLLQFISVRFLGFILVSFYFLLLLKICAIF